MKALNGVEDGKNTGYIHTARMRQSAEGICGFLTGLPWFVGVVCDNLVD